MSRALRLCLLAALHLSALKVIAQGTLYTLVTNGPTSARLNVVFLAEGYTASQTALFTNDARSVLKAILTKPPYSEYSNYFNAFAIFVPSVESGADHPASNLYRNTYFNSTYDSYGIERLLTIPPNDLNRNYSDGRGKVAALLASLLPEYDIVALIVNDPEYGGSGGAYELVTSTHSLSPEIIVHELGHNLGGLGDEYGTAYPGYPDVEEPNTTQQTNRALIKWNAWILPATPIPTPAVSSYADSIGLFEGAHYHTNGWYRPRSQCTMQTLGVAFCSVCSEQLVKSIYNYVPPINTCVPATNSPIQLAAAASATFTAVVNQPSTHKLRIQWSINGAPVAGSTNPAFTLAAGSLANGTNRLTVSVWDPTPLVRIDPEALLTDERTWSVKAALALPALRIALLPNQAVLSWPTSAVSFHLESSPDLPATLWTSNPGPTVVTGSFRQATIPLTGARQFFRLKQQP